MIADPCSVQSRPMETPSHAVFLSYATEDSEAAQRIAEALRGAGIEVWFDKSELRGGDAWDPDSQAPDAEAAAAAIEKVARPLQRRGGSGQGYGLTQQERRTVELHAMSMAKQHLEGLGLTVEDVSATESFDFRAKESERELFIEVKGTTGSYKEILLTASEVALHRRVYQHNALIVVYQINLDRSHRTPLASGGFLRAFKPWRIQPEALTPSAYKYSITEHEEWLRVISE